MARARINLGTWPSNNNWNGSVLVPGSLTASGDDIYLRRLHLTNFGSFVQVVVQFSSTSTGSGILVGPDLNNDFENYISAITLINHEDTEIVIPGPNHSSIIGRDRTEPYQYFWNVGSTGGTRLEVLAWLRGAPGDDVTLVLDDGTTGPYEIEELTFTGEDSSSSIEPITWYGRGVELNYTGEDSTSSIKPFTWYDRDVGLNYTGEDSSSSIGGIQLSLQELELSQTFFDLSSTVQVQRTPIDVEISQVFEDLIPSLSARRAVPSDIPIQLIRQVFGRRTSSQTLIVERYYAEPIDVNLSQTFSDIIQSLSGIQLSSLEISLLNISPGIVQSVSNVFLSDIVVTLPVQVYQNLVQSVSGVQLSLQEIELLSISPDLISSIRVQSSHLRVILEQTHQELVATLSGVFRIPFRIRVTNVEIANKTVTLTLSESVQSGDDIRLDYTVPDVNPIEDLAQNPADAIASIQVTNNTR